jgi:predicted site-specific integrase-resolvase
MPLTITEAATFLGRHVKTLQMWDREGTLTAFRSPTGRRYYDEESLRAFAGLPADTRERKLVAYCRVSSQSQKPDLKNQIQIVQEYCKSVLFEKAEIIEEIGGGLNLKRKKFLSLIDDIVGGNIKGLVVAHKDRLSRFGFELVQHLCVKNRVSLYVIDRQEASPEQEMVQDLMAITHCFSARLYGLRNYRVALAKAVKADQK